ncbi:hypothetical protein I551_9198 [Mycobacterium ulcerans str. Harvey]|uniref:Uncharacterized protein n=1 Tax=Mycobacterium ulcerans str. Harvey TaxID=1299332 RepID=A0ABP3AR49_MYCUL|nr:hypothetical protein I551_9198 [Mycobacterium ulcerans str. Harvey]
MSELRLVGAPATDPDATPSPLDTEVPSGNVTAVWRPFQPITKALGRCQGSGVVD